MSKQVTLTIDGNQVTVPDGIVVADAAKMAGIDIPVFCHHPKLEPVGMCRMCLVEIGRPMRDRATGQFVMENGAPKRKSAVVNAPTGQMSEVLPEKTESNPGSDKETICIERPRSSKPITESPAISS